MVNRLIRSTHFDAVFATINQTLSPVYIGIVLAFLMCPITNWCAVFTISCTRTGNC